MTKYKTGFFILLGLFIIFWLWIITAVLLNTSPKRVVKNLFIKKNTKMEDNYIIPVSFYEEQNWIKNISPDSTSIRALSGNNNRIIIEFNQDMDTDFYHLSGRSIYTIDAPLEYDMYWQNNRLFIIQLKHSLNNGEYFILKIEFRNTDKYYFPTMVLNYE